MIFIATIIIFINYYLLLLIIIITFRCTCCHCCPCQDSEYEYVWIGLNNQHVWMNKSEHDFMYLNMVLCVWTCFNMSENIWMCLILPKYVSRCVWICLNVSYLVRICLNISQHVLICLNHFNNRLFGYMDVLYIFRSMHLGVNFDFYDIKIRIFRISISDIKLHCKQLAAVQKKCNNYNFPCDEWKICIHGTIQYRCWYALVLNST